MKHYVFDAFKVSSNPLDATTQHVHPPNVEARHWETTRGDAHLRHPDAPSADACNLFGKLRLPERTAGSNLVRINVEPAQRIDNANGRASFHPRIALNLITT